QLLLQGGQICLINDERRLTELGEPVAAVLPLELEQLPLGIDRPVVQRDVEIGGHLSLYQHTGALLLARVLDPVPRRRLPVRARAEGGAVLRDPDPRQHLADDTERVLGLRTPFDVPARGVRERLLLAVDTAEAA